MESRYDPLKMNNRSNHSTPSYPVFIRKKLKKPILPLPFFSTSLIIVNVTNKESSCWRLPMMLLSAELSARFTNKRSCSNGTFAVLIKNILMPILRSWSHGTLCFMPVNRAFKNSTSWDWENQASLTAFAISNFALEAPSSTTAVMQKIFRI